MSELAKNLSITALMLVVETLAAKELYDINRTTENFEFLCEKRGKLETYIAELEAAQRWRVVADGELPNKNDYYLARDDLGQQGVILFYDGEWNKFTNLSYITLWMPLPELPKERER